MSFQDYFSAQAEIYAKIRPHYPERLYKFLANHLDEHKLAWDCATGNGQAALGLTPFFDKIVATDASKKQLEHAIKHDKIEYRIAPAEDSSFLNESVNLVTVATAAHWFDLERFYKEVNRVLKKGGLLAVWSYAGNSVNAEIDVLLNDFAFNFLKEYWPGASYWNWENKYKDLPFPYPLISAPEFVIKKKWNLKNQVAYIYSWSATQNYIKKHNKDPLEEIISELLNLWGDETIEKSVTWNLHTKIGRKEK